jgi:hypothetical protein
MEQLKIGGRTFQVTGESTARHDMWTMRQIAACGLNVVNQAEGETEEAFIYRLYMTALQTGDVFLLLGGLLIPEGMDPLKWTPETAAATANFLASLTASEDKGKLRILLASALMPFFMGGHRSSMTSRNSSTPRTPGSGQPPIESADGHSTGTGD